VGIQYDGSTLGRVIIGPYRDLRSGSPSRNLLEAVSGLDAEHAEQLRLALPAAEPVTVDRLASYVRRMLDLVLFSGHRALLTTNMHLVSVRESYRELTDKSTRLQRAYDRLKELDRLKSNFLATVSHELRTPLTSVIGYSELLAAGIAGDMSAEQLEFVDTIRQKGEQLLELIKGLLDLSKLESGTMSLRKGQVDVARLMADVGDTLRPMALKKGVALASHIEDGVPSVWGDVGRLSQVVINLGENAIKFTPAGGSVELLAQAATMAGAGDDDGPIVLLAAGRPAVEIRVADSGIGIPDAERERVFDSFYQVDSSATRQQGGAGLGLAIVKRLVEAHDGTIRIEANQPCGTVVVATIPARKLSDG
jgi:signal transduction histidine kinase